MSENVGFTAKQLRFIEWLAVGKYDRSPSTQALLADELGVNEDTLTRWKRGNHKYTKADWDEAVTARARELNWEAIPNVYNSLRDEAEKGSYQHQKLLLELVGEYTQRQELTGADGSSLNVVVTWGDNDNA